MGDFFVLLPAKGVTHWITDFICAVEPYGRCTVIGNKSTGLQERETPKLNCRPLTCGAPADIWNGSNSLSLTHCVCFLLCSARIDFETLRGSYKTTRLNDHTLSGAIYICICWGAALTATTHSPIVAVAL